MRILVGVQAWKNIKQRPTHSLLVQEKTFKASFLQWSRIIRPSQVWPNSSSMCVRKDDQLEYEHGHSQNSLPRWHQKQLSVSSNEFASSKSKQPRDPVPSNTPRYSFGVVTRHLRLARSVVCEIAYVAGVKRGKGREDLGAWSRALIPFLFPFVRLSRKPFAKAPSKGARDACLTT